MPGCHCRSRAGRNLDAMIVGVGNDVQDALVRQTIGIGPYLSFPRVNDVPMQWVQLLNGFDQQGIISNYIINEVKT